MCTFPSLFAGSQRTQATCRFATATQATCLFQLTQATCLSAAASATKAPAQAPPKLELVLGRKWSIENHTGNRSLIVDQTDPKQSVYIFNCSNCTVQVCACAPICRQCCCNASQSVASLLCMQNSCGEYYRNAASQKHFLV